MTIMTLPQPVDSDPTMDEALCRAREADKRRQSAPYTNPLARACAGLPPALFYGDAPEAQLEALLVCRDCPLKLACANWAMTWPADDQWGVAGGLTARTRRALIMQAQRRCRRPATQALLARRADLEQRLFGKTSAAKAVAR